VLANRVYWGPLEQSTKTNDAFSYYYYYYYYYYTNFYSAESPCESEAFLR